MDEGELNENWEQLREGVFRLEAKDFGPSGAGSDSHGKIAHNNASAIARKRLEITDASL